MCRPWSVKCRVWSVKCSLSIEKMKCTARRIYQWSQDEKEFAVPTALDYVNFWTACSEWPDWWYLENDALLYQYPLNQFTQRIRSYSATRGTHTAHPCFAGKHARNKCRKNLLTRSLLMNRARNDNSNLFQRIGWQVHLIREKNRCVCDLLSYPKAQYWYIHLTCLSVSIYRLGGSSGSRMPIFDLAKNFVGKSPSTPLLDKLKAEFWGR